MLASGRWGPWWKSRFRARQGHVMLLPLLASPNAVNSESRVGNIQYVPIVQSRSGSVALSTMTVGCSVNASKWDYALCTSSFIASSRGILEKYHGSPMNLHALPCTNVVCSETTSLSNFFEHDNSNGVTWKHQDIKVLCTIYRLSHQVIKLLQLVLTCWARVLTLRCLSLNERDGFAKPTAMMH